VGINISWVVLGGWMSGITTGSQEIVIGISELEPVIGSRSLAFRSRCSVFRNGNQWLGCNVGKSGIGRGRWEFIFPG
jgi:hypothetical protein